MQGIPVTGGGSSAVMLRHHEDGEKKHAPASAGIDGERAGGGNRFVRNGCQEERMVISDHTKIEGADENSIVRPGATTVAAHGIG